MAFWMLRNRRSSAATSCLPNVLSTRASPKIKVCVNHPPRSHQQARLRNCKRRQMEGRYLRSSRSVRLSRNGRVSLTACLSGVALQELYVLRIGVLDHLALILVVVIQVQVDHVDHGYHTSISLMHAEAKKKVPYLEKARRSQRQERTRYCSPSRQLACRSQ